MRLAQPIYEVLADVTMTHLKFPNGVSGHVFVSWLHPFKEQKLVAIGSESMAVFTTAYRGKINCNITHIR